MNKKLLLLSLVSFASQTNTMDAPVTEQVKQLKPILADKLSSLITFHSGLPIELNSKICGYTCVNSSAESLDDAAQIMSILTQTSKALKGFFSNSNNCLYIIKKLSERFDCSNENVTKKLFTKAARKRRYLQNTFKLFCRRGTQPAVQELAQEFAKLKKDSVDFEFTYGYDCWTGLMLTLQYNDYVPNVAKYLISNNAEINRPDKRGYSAQARLFYNCPDLIPFLLGQRKIELNKRDEFGGIPLTYLMQGLCELQHNNFALDIIKTGIITLLEHGADPECVNDKGEYPLMLAYKYRRQYLHILPESFQFVTLFEDAIKKKYATKN